MHGRRVEQRRHLREAVDDGAGVELPVAVRLASESASAIKHRARTFAQRRADRARTVQALDHQALAAVLREASLGRVPNDHLK